MHMQVFIAEIKRTLKLVRINIKEKVKSKKGNKKKNPVVMIKERQGSKVRMEETVGEPR